MVNLLLTSAILCTRRSRTPKTRRIWRDPSGLFRRSSSSESPQSGRSRAAAARDRPDCGLSRSEEHTSELQSPYDLVCRLLLEKQETIKYYSGSLVVLR